MNGTYYEKPFLNHFIDAIVLCEMADDLPFLHMSRHSSLARSSIMASIFSLEAAANILMTPIRSPQMLLDMVDQRPSLDKYEFILFGVQPDKKFDRGAKYVQRVRELFEIRNKYVHPKSKAHAISSRELGEGAITIQKQDKPNNLGLPISPDDWAASHAHNVLKAASDFLDYFVIDLCEFEADMIRRLFLNTIEINDKNGLVFPDEQKNVLHRAVSKYSIDFRMTRLLLDLSESNGRRVKLLFSYSWGLRGMQLHGQNKIIEIDGEGVSSEIVANAVQLFLIWFEEAEHYPYGRRLIEFEVRSEDKSARYASFRTYITDWMEEAQEGTGKHRPIGIVADVKGHLFFNAVLGLRRDKNDLLLTVILDSGKGRELRLSLNTCIQFIQSVSMNRRNEWVSEGTYQGDTVTIENKGSDYEVDEVDMIAFDPRSRTTLWTYKARSGKLMQANMKPATLMTIFNLIQDIIVESSNKPIENLSQ
jgi:hypothetical protein